MKNVLKLCFEYEYIHKINKIQYYASLTRLYRRGGLMEKTLLHIMLS